MSNGQATGADASGMLARALRRLLRPLVRLLLEKQLEYPFVAGLLKDLYVEVAEQDLAIPSKKPTDSRISLLTGIHRREVKRIRAAIHEGETIPASVATGALLVSRWIGDPRFLDEDGRPRSLPRRAPEPEPSFESLVTSVTINHPPRSVLDEWMRLGIVEEDETGNLRLVSESFVPDQGLEEKIHFFGRNLRDHISAGAENLLGQSPPFFDRSIYYDQLSEESAAALSALVREEGAALLRRVNQSALDMQRRDTERNDATHRMTVGAYFYSGDDSGEPASRPRSPGEEEEGQGE